MGQVVNSPLPHHRRAPLFPVERAPRIDERRNAPGEEVTLAGWFVILYGIGLLAIIAFALGSIGA